MSREKMEIEKEVKEAPVIIMRKRRREGPMVKKKSREIVPLAPFGVAEMNLFYSKVLMDPNLEADDSSAHMIFMSEKLKAKKRNDYEKTPYWWIRGRYVSAQRISYFLEYGQDPLKAAYIRLECNEQRCINPRHLSYSKPEPKLTKKRNTSNTFL